MPDFRPLTGDGGPGPLGHQLRLVFWETTAGCNLTCRHCRRLDICGTGLAPGDMETEEALRFVEDIAAFARPILVLSGGEPLIRKDIFRIARRAADLGLPVALATNGVLIDDTLADRIVASGVRRVAISFDGATPEVHDEFRGLPGSFDLAVAGFRRLKARGMNLQVNSTIARHNDHQLDQIVTLAKALGADALHFFMLVPVGCGVELSRSQQLTPERYEEVLNWVYDKTLENPGLQIKATCAPHYFRIILERGGRDMLTKGHGHGTLHQMTRGCLAGTAVCFVSHKGQVFPCGYLPVEAGNVRETPFREIWSESSLFATLRDTGNLTGKCGLCEYKNVCLGCRARSFGETGDYLAEEPYCTYEPKRVRMGK
ncbi:MAG: radical SAM protein [Candidatus Glassbacteria bacterium]